jgi:hypothetical protein
MQLEKELEKIEVVSTNPKSMRVVSPPHNLH